LFLSSSSAWFIVPPISSWFSLGRIDVYTSATLDSSWFSYTSAMLDSSWFSLHHPSYWSVNQTYARVTVIHSSSSVILTCKPELRPIFSLFANYPVLDSSISSIALLVTYILATPMHSVVGHISMHSVP
jgi:hypothetical protein